MLLPVLRLRLRALRRMRSSPEAVFKANREREAEQWQEREQ